MKAFFGFAFEPFQALHVVAGAECGGDQGLRFSSCEDGAAVGSWQHAGFDPDVAHFVEGAGVRTPLLIDHLLAEDALAQRLVVVIQFRAWLHRRLPANRQPSFFLMSLTSV